MHRSHNALAVSRLAILGVAILLFTAGCGGGGGGQTGDTHGTDTPASISHIDQILGIQGTLYADPDGYVVVNYHVQDGQYDLTDVEVQYGVDTDGSNQIEDDEYVAATAAPGSEGTVGLNSSPGGAAHSFKWHSVADIVTNRYVVQDYEYTADGRRAVDAFGDTIYRAYPGVKFRIRPIVPVTFDGVWRYTDAFSISNNHPPEVTSFLESNVVIPAEGIANNTVNEIVNLLWQVQDEDSDPVTIAVDWLLVDENFDPSGLTPEEAESQAWRWATSAPVVPPLSEGTEDLPANPTDTPHGYGWDSVVDAGTENTGVWLRIRPIDGKNEVGDWVYMDQPFHLNNFAIFTELDPLADTRLGTEATLLTNGNVLLTGGQTSDTDPADDNATVFYPTTQTQTLSGSTAAITDGMLFPRAGHTATRLFRQDDPNDGTKLLDAKVLIVGGLDGVGDPQTTAEMYDPATPAGTNPFSAVASMATPRAGHFAILLSSGKVLVGGGVDDNGTVLDSAEVYDPVADTWATVGTTMGDARTDAEAVLLPGLEGSEDEDGFILVAGGSDGTNSLKSIEIFNILSGEFENVDIDMNSARAGLSLSPTLDDVWAVVAAGGEASPPTNSIERYNQFTETWATSSVQMGEERSGHLGLLQGDGTILLCGGVMDINGNFAETAELYDPDRDTIRLANGNMGEPVGDAAGVVLTNGRTVIFGGDSETGAQACIQAWTPETETGFNTPPTVQVRTPTAIEPWAFGVRIFYRAQDTEGDDVRIVAQFKVKEGNDPISNPDATNTAIWTQSMKDQYLDRWLPAAMQVQTVLGDESSGTSGLEARTDVVSQATNPIDNPDDPNSASDLGEHLFVWKTNGGNDPVTSLENGGLPKGDYNNVYFRVIVYGATEGGVATTGSFGMTKNAPVIARIDPPIQDTNEGNQVYGNVVFPFYLQDSDPGEYATLTWEFGKDLNNDGKVVQGEFVPGVGTEGWVGMTMTDTSVTVSLNGDGYTNPTDFKDIPTAPTGNEHGTIPWGVKGHFIWNSVNDVGADENAVTNIFVRCTPYDSPNTPSATTDQSLGIGSERSGWTLNSDPNGLYLDSWSPTVNSTPDPGVFEYTGAGTNEPIQFNFTNNVTNVSDTTIIIAEKGSSVPIKGVFITSGATVTWYPQVDELAHPTGILKANTDYQITMYGWDPLFSGRDIIHAAGANALDANAYHLLHDGSSANAFQTGSGAFQESTNPAYTAPLVLPATTTGVSTTLTKIEMMFNEFIDPGTVNHTNFEVYIEAFNGVESVVPGVFTLENRTNATTGVQTGKIIYTFAGAVSLPKGATVQIRAKTGLTDLYGNALSSEAAPTFTMEGVGGSTSTSWVESFTTTTYRDYDETTVWWGDNDPKIPGDFAGAGTDGEVTGLFDFGNGTTDLYLSGTYTSTSTYNTLECRNLTTTTGTVTLRGTHPWTIRCTGSATISGTINASGSKGQDSHRYAGTCVINRSGPLTSGGAGGPSGGQGSSAGYWTNGATTPITYNDAKNYAGTTSGSGTGGSGVGIASTASYYPRYMPGGGGAGHAGKGTAGGHGYGNAGGNYPNGGYLNIKGGAAGATYGTQAMTTLTSGSGGGAGGNKISRYYASAYYFNNPGGGGGGGGGIFRLIAADGIDLTSTGKIQANGGAGGYADYYYYVNGRYIYSYPGGGGGGSGGSVDLQSPDITMDGTLDVSGGAGGHGAYTYSSYAGNGGAGGGGRVRLKMAGSVWMVNAVVTSDAATIVCGGGGTANWTVSTNTAVNTTTGAGGVGWNSSAKQFRVKDFTVNSGTTLTVAGDNPFVVLATGNVSLNGTINAAGGDGRGKTSYDYTGSTSAGWYHYDEYRTNYSYYHDSPTQPGGPGGGTGGSRGALRTYTNSYGWYHKPTSFANPKDGGGWNSATGTTGAGKGGRANSTGYTRYQYTKYYYYYYYGGAGGGGASVQDGTIGLNPRYYGSTTYGRGTPGAAGTANVVLTSMSPTTVRGGAGGGGGVMGGVYITTYNYRYTRGHGNAGGGGGGAIGICAEGTIHIDADIDVSGGNGGSQLYTYYYYTFGEGAGGGGGGGNVRMHAKGGFTFGAPSIDCGGGTGGRTVYYSNPDTSTPFTQGGNGGKGGLHLTAPVDPADTTMPTVALSAAGLNLGTGGTLVVNPFAVSDTAVSTFYDTGTMIPTYIQNAAPWSGTGLKDLWVEGAMADPADGTADPDSGTGWVKLIGTGGSIANISDLHGYRYVRFKLTISAGASVTAVTVNWSYPN